MKANEIPDDGCGPLPKTVFVEQYKDGEGEDVYFTTSDSADLAFECRNNDESDYVVVGEYKLVRRLLLKQAKPKLVTTVLK